MHGTHPSFSSDALFRFHYALGDTVTGAELPPHDVGMIQQRPIVINPIIQLKPPLGPKTDQRIMHFQWGFSRTGIRHQEVSHGFCFLSHHRLIPIFKEEIDDPKFFDLTP